MLPATIVAGWQPAVAGKRAGSMFVRLARTREPSVRTSATATNPPRLGFSPELRERSPRRVKPMQTPPPQLSPVVTAFPSSHASPFLRFSHPTAGGVHTSVVHRL